MIDGNTLVPSQMLPIKVRLLSLENSPNKVMDYDNTSRGVVVDGNTSAPSQTMLMELKGGLSSLETIPTLTLDCEEALEVLGSPNREVVFDSSGSKGEHLRRLGLALERMSEEVHTL